MLRLLRHDQSPPDFFRFLNSETGHTSRANDYWTWTSLILEHRRANNLPIPDNMVELAEDQLCKTLPPGYCKQDEGDRSLAVSTRLTWGDIVAGAKAYIGALLGKFDFVSQAEAERRAAICTGCYFNVNPEGCGTCRKMGNLITGDLAARHTTSDARLKACAVCRCPNQSVVHFPMEVLEQHDTPDKQERYPNFCWRQKLGENYRPNEEMAFA